MDPSRLDLPDMDLAPMDPAIARLSHQARERQALAADPHASAWVSASAGSGKTKVLIDRLLRLLLSGAEPHRILALTFTKAAAAEMANRLNDKLAAWAVMPPQALADSLHETLLARPPSETELERAQALFAAVLDTPGGMKIQTIHAFCQSLLGRFPVESKTTARFRLLDDRAAAELFDRELAGLITDANSPQGAALRQAFAQLAPVMAETRFRDLMTLALRERDRLQAFFTSSLNLDGAKALLAQRLSCDADQNEIQLVEQALSAAAIEAHHLRPAWQTLMQAGTAKFREKLGGLQSLIDGTWQHSLSAMQQWQAVKAVLLKADGDILTHNFPSAPVVRAHPEAVDALRAYQQHIKACQEAIKALRLWRLNVAFLTLAQALLTRIERAKQARGVLDFDDLIARTARLLDEDSAGAAPARLWVHYKLDQGLDHILVDEAQDTNSEQWHVIRQLADLFFDDSSGQEPRPRSLFVVGDEKQSIYSFQRADPRAFADMRAYFAARARAAEQPFHALDFNISFRSTSEVLDAVNTSFSPPHVFKGVLAPSISQWPQHEAFRAAVPGCVEVWPRFETEKTDKGAQQWQLPLEPQHSEDAGFALAQALAEQVHYWCHAPEGLDDPQCYVQQKGGGVRRIQEGDIMVLLRARTGFVDQLTALLKEKGVQKVAGRDRMRLSQQLVVTDLLSLARFLVLPDDDLNLAGLLKSPLLELTEDQLFALAHARGSHTLWRRVRDSQDGDVQAARDFLSECLRYADAMPLYELFVWVLGYPAANRGAVDRLQDRPLPLPGQARTGKAALLYRLGPDASDAIDEFLALAMEYDAQHPPSLQGFLHWFERAEQDIKRDLEQEHDKLRIMTVHGSKGLQAPIVILPVLETRQRHDMRLFFDAGLPLWLPNQDLSETVTQQLKEAQDALDAEESRRLLYVAMTRAEDRLLIAAARGTQASSQPSWYDLVETALNSKLSPAERLPAGLAALLPGSIGRLCPRGFPSLSDNTSIAAPQSIPTPAQVIGAALPSWVSAPPPGEPSPPRPLRPSDTEAAPRRFRLSGTAHHAALAGQITHSLLQFLPDMPPEQRLAACQRYLARQGLPPQQAARLQADTMALLSNPDLAFVFSPGSRAEVPLAGHVGQHIITGRIDRLHISADRIMLVDYKTGTPPSTAGIPHDYALQLQRYMQVLAQIKPNLPIEAYLLWTQNGRLDKLVFSQ